MNPISENQKTEIISLMREGKLNREQIAVKVGVSPGTVSAIKAHLTMGTYAEPSEAEEVIDAMETTFGLERDLQIALRSNIQQLEQGLKIIDEGKELTTEAGRIDITAEDQQGAIVVIELKAGSANPDCVAQILSYMGALREKEQRPIRGILVAGDFPPRVVFAARAVPNLQLRKYTFRFSFEEVK
ncbi:MAG: endonuclease NucS [Methanocellales archaeon]|nr:endonuclease NucS [Methanocellales archaeon]MDD3291627.1 endonuclease NucS [Methanocellales archaeon]MDD5235196.1 endonuclease NucS [Methanocellales archaeon]MDD5485410.1 endonuclease NucS [Methanocellales archaeon]